MSRIVDTKLGRFRAVEGGQKKWWLWECPCCKTWHTLSLDQMEGRISVYCDALVPQVYGLNPATDTKACGYHQTHEYAKELVVTIQSRMLMGEEPWHEDVDCARNAGIDVDRDLIP